MADHASVDPNLQTKGVEKWLGSNSNIAILRVLGAIIVLDIIVVGVLQILS